MMHIAELYFYPIKSLPGISVESLTLTEVGPEFDRNWMLVDSENRFYTLRKNPTLYDFSFTWQPDSQVVEISFPGAESQSLPLIPEANKIAGAGYHEVVIWGDRVQAAEPYPELSKWFSYCLEENLTLVYFSEQSQRTVDSEFSPQQRTVTFADGFPLLVTNQASLHQFSQWLGREIEMLRFRPNIVLQGAEPWAEDQHEGIVINDLIIDLVKPCTRCTIPTIDPDSEEKQPDIQKALLKYRRQESGVLFGQNGIHRTAGTLHIQDPVEWIETK